jgi:hypothetical protein
MQRSTRTNNQTIRGTNIYTIIILVSIETRILQKEENNSNQTFCKKEEAIRLGRHAQNLFFDPKNVKSNLPLNFVCRHKREEEHYVHLLNKYEKRRRKKYTSMG